MKYTVEICNKYHNYVEKIKDFDTYEKAIAFVSETDIDIDKDSEYFEITEIEN